MDFANLALTGWLTLATLVMATPTIRWIRHNWR